MLIIECNKSNFIYESTTSGRVQIDISYLEDINSSITVESIACEVFKGLNYYYILTIDRPTHTTSNTKCVYNFTDLIYGTFDDIHTITRKEKLKYYLSVI